MLLLVKLSGGWVGITATQGVFLKKGVLKICSKFTGEHPCRNAISINRTLAWVFSCKFAAYLQKTFSQEQL